MIRCCGWIKRNATLRQVNVELKWVVNGTKYVLRLRGPRNYESLEHRLCSSARPNSATMWDEAHGGKLHLLEE